MSNKQGTPTRSTGGRDNLPPPPPPPTNESSHPGHPGTLSTYAYCWIDINIPFQGMNGALSADLARVLNLQGQPASPTHMQVLYLSEEETKASSLYQQLD